MAIDSLNIQAIFTDGISSALEMTEIQVVHAHVETIPGDDNDLSQLILTDGMGVLDPLTVDFVDECVPEYPVYLRWINRFGGWEYFMFTGNKDFTASMDIELEYQPASGMPVTATRSREVGAITQEEIVSCGATQLSPAMFSLVSSIQFSPRIDMWNAERGEWEGVTIDDKASATWETRGVIGQVSLKLRLIDQETQF